jgi:hypothetical protein
MCTSYNRKCFHCFLQKIGDVDNPPSLVPLSDIKKWVKQALEERQITNFEIRVKGAAQKGDGLLCNITFVEVTSKTISDKRVLYNFAIKSSKKNKKLREKIPLGVLGVNELRLHAFQPVIFCLQERLKIGDVFDHLPLYYYSCYNPQDEEIIIMQDLKVEGYCTHDRKLPMGIDQVR